VPTLFFFPSLTSIVVGSVLFSFFSFVSLDPVHVSAFFLELSHLSPKIWSLWALTAAYHCLSSYKGTPLSFLYQLVYRRSQLSPSILVLFHNFFLPSQSPSSLVQCQSFGFRLHRPPPELIILMIHSKTFYPSILIPVWRFH